MKHYILFSILLVVMSPAVAALAEESEASKPDRAALEKKFKKDLTDVTFVGRWRLVKDGKLGEEKEDRYTIRSVTRVGQAWFITARIQYGDLDVTVPVPVRVEWAGDTPVISVTNAGIPGVGTYTARVVISGGLYAGTWFGKGYGGLMSGAIVKNAPEAEKKSPGAGRK